MNDKTKNIIPFKTTHTNEILRCKINKTCTRLVTWKVWNTGERNKRHKEMQEILCSCKT